MFCDTCINRAGGGWCCVQDMDVYASNYCKKYQGSELDTKCED